MNEETDKQSRNATIGEMLNHEAATHVPPDHHPPSAPIIPDTLARQLKKLFFSPAALFCLLLLYVLVSRTWNLADKVMHHDESLFAYYGYWLFMGRGYDYQPILHGPVLQFVSAFFFLLFGDDQWTMRLPNLIGGLLMFPVAWHWRRYLGGGAAALIGVTALIALSPSITYYARFLRNDVPYLTATIWCALCTLRLLHTGRPLYAWGSVMAATLMFCMMESSIFFFAACLGYLTTMILVDNFIWRSPKTGQPRRWPQWLENEIHPSSSNPTRKSYRKFTLGQIALLAIPAALSATLIIGWLYWRMLMETVPLWAPLQLIAGKAGLTLSQNTTLAIISLLGLAIAYAGAFIAIQSYHSPRGRYGIITWITHALWRNRWHILAAIALGVIAYTTLFTTFFTHTRTASFDHTARDFAGPERALTPVQIYKNTWDYWWDQHKLHRIKGPFHYYLPILFLYELPTLALVFTGWIRAIWSARRRWLLLTSLIAAHIVLAIIIKIIPPIDWEMMDQKFHLEEHFHLFQVLIFAQLLVVIAPLLFLQGRRVESFLTYWAVTSLFAYSYAGEKVPWLTIHSAAPFALLATAQLVWIWRRLRHPVLENSFTPATPAPALRYRRPWKIAFLIIAISGALYQVRTNHLLNFVHPWSPAERLIYNHTSPDLHTAVALIEDLSAKTNFGHQIPIYMNGEMGWPLHWYLRDYTNIMPPYGETADNTTRPIVMIDWHHAGTPNIVENYSIRRMKVREWWEPARLDLRAMTDLYMVFTQQEARQSNFAMTQRYQDMKTEWRKLWRYMAYREIWIDPANPGWSNGANEFCFAVRNDIAEQLMSYQWLSATPKRVDVTPYQPQ